MIEVLYVLHYGWRWLRDKTYIGLNAQSRRTETERQNNHVFDFWNGRLCNNPDIWG